MHQPAGNGDSSVLVLSERADLTADAVILALTKRDVPVVRFDPADFPESARCDATLAARRWNGVIGVNGDYVVDLAKVRAVYYRRPRIPRVSAALRNAEHEWATKESTAGIYGVLAALDCRYVNHPAAIHPAQSKPYALSVAAQAGLAVPATIVTNDPGAARRFAAKAGAVVCKPLAGGGVREHGRAIGMHTTTVDPATFDSSIRSCAHQFQYRVDKAYEVRLTAVADRLFAARIDAHSPIAREDFRADYDACSYQPNTIPDDVATGVRDLLARLNLNYAALDFLVDHDHRWWICDVNPAGPVPLA